MITSNLLVLLLSGFFYLLTLFILAHLADQNRIPQSWINNPWVYSLSIGVYATSWSFYGSVGFAQANGLMFITIYIGATLTFLISPILLSPILKLTQAYQLSSLADVLTFRFRSQFIGVLVTLFMLVGTLPYIALQIRAITESLQILTDQIPSDMIAFGYCILIMLFSMAFGAKHISAREKHHGLVAAIAFESLVKFIALMMVSFFAWNNLTPGSSGIGEWLNSNPEAIEKLYQPVKEGPWLTFLFLAFSAAFLLPRQFHMIFSENLNPQHLKTAAWVFPLFLLLFNVPIPLLLWTGSSLQLDMPADYYVLGIALQSENGWLAIITFIGGLSAASAMIVITSLALSSMCLNHLLLPSNFILPGANLYSRLLWSRRLLVALIVFAGYLFFSLLKHNQGLVQLGLISFVAVTQFIPGVIGLLYWKNMTRAGFISGLIGGILSWFLMLIVPLFDPSSIPAWLARPGELYKLVQMNKWELATLLSLTLNGGISVIVSFYTTRSQEEIEAANACCTENSAVSEGMVVATSVDEFREELAVSLGNETANIEVDKALADLNMAEHENHPSRLIQLRSQLEQNLSGLIGPQLAYILINKRLHLDKDSKTALAHSIRHIEEKLADSNVQLQGISAELNELARMHKEILQSLPLGVCVIDDEQHILLWNDALAQISQLDVKHSGHLKIEQLPQSWRDLLQQIVTSKKNHLYRIEALIDGENYLFNLHKSSYIEPLRYLEEPLSFGSVLLIEDITEIRQLEAEVAHNDRLASLGRLSAGVAHEIGNPVTAISCVIQNLLPDEKNDGQIKQYQAILAQCDRINTILKSMTSFSRSNSQLQSKQHFDLVETVKNTIHLAKLTCKQDKRHFEFSSEDESTAIEGDEQAITQALLNLLNNAIDASPINSTISVNLWREKTDAMLEISDQGSGIDARDLEVIFEPFFTTKAAGQGTGLGLAITHKIILNHGGTIKISSVAGQGTQVRLKLPLYDE